MFVLAGLGNPGPTHARNRHNVGFMAVDAMARLYRFPPFRARFQGDAAEGKIGDERVLLLKPLTYMNESGRSVAEALRFYKVELDRLVVLHDELDLAPGKLRVKQGGGAAGHNGLRSLDAHLGPGYRRVRLGIGHPGVRDVVKQHVLQNFAKADADWLEPLLDAIAAAAPLLVAEPPGSGDSAFMSKVALILNPPAPKPPRKEPPKTPVPPPADGSD